ncbi:MAG: YbaB/EbfC family nucleoid-associated protein [Deltaproteobacteria bacterium]|jgi:nucleoid-associated protein EbfC|nr:YbaB/EbfC family nucleoid-associated protein [Deltaproteobacteria bacterium]
MANMNEMMKQAKQMQDRLMRAKEDAALKTIEASAGGNMVTVVVSGRPEVVSLRIDPSVVSADDTEMLQDLVIAAVNEGIRKSQKMVEDEMSKLLGGLKIPGL